MFNRLFNRDDMHADAIAAERNHRGDAFQRHLCHQIEECGNLGMLIRELVIHHHELGRAGHEDRHIVLLVMILILTVHFEHTDP